MSPMEPVGSPHVLETLPLGIILSHLKHVLPFYFSKIQFTILLPSIPISSKRFLHIRFSDQNFVNTCSLSHAFCVFSLILVSFQFHTLILMLCLAGMIVKAVTPKPQGDLVNGSSELSMSASENSLLLQYKDLIREQDHRLQELTQTIDRLTVDKSTLQVRHL